MYYIYCQKEITLYFLFGLLMYHQRSAVSGQQNNSEQTIYERKRLGYLHLSLWCKIFLNENVPVTFPAIYEQIKQLT